MQATVTTNRFGVNRSSIKLAAAALGLVGSIAIGGAAISFSGEDDATPIRSRSVVVAPAQTTSNPHFMEMNQLPEAGDTLMMSDRASMVEMFRQDSGIAPIVAPSNHRFLDMNVLPEAPAVIQPNYRLMDLNVLPGDDTPELPPAAQWGATRY